MPIQQSTLGCFLQEKKKEDVKKEETKEKEIKEEVREKKVKVKREKTGKEKEIKKPAEPVKIKNPEPIQIETPIKFKIIKSGCKTDERYSYEVRPFRLRMIEYGL